MNGSCLSQFKLRALLAGGVTATALLAATAQHASDCQGIATGETAECRHYNAGTLVRQPVQPNTASEPPAPLGTIGFSISIDEPAADEATGPKAPRRTISGAPAPLQGTRGTDQMLATAKVDLTYDGLGARPRLAIATQDLRQDFLPGEVVTFRASSNYPDWIDHAQVIITTPRDEVIATLPIAPNGTADWIMPDGEGNDYRYHLRVSDAGGRRDITRSTPLARVSETTSPALTGPITAPAEGDDMTARRSIAIRGGAVTLSGQRLTDQPVQISGETVPVDPAGRFVVQRILPPGQHDVAIALDGQRMNRPVTIESSEWFATGIADLTLGHDRDGTWRMGRIAGFAQGTLANGTRITASADTREQELRDLFRNFGRKFPDQTLREMESQDVFNTFGDDSQISDLAPTSGRFFLRAARDGSHLQWGDFKPQETSGLTVRSDRALYGASGVFCSLDVTNEGESRIRLSGFAAQADSLMQRDILRATGGSAYFLSRQDIIADSESILIEVRSRSTGLLIESRRLAEGRDYRINPVQGVIILHTPLSGATAGEGLIADNPLGDHDVNLVAQYEYVPTTGDIDGYTAGLRGEYWWGQHLRLGASGLRETTGLADQDLLGVDLLLHDGDSRELLLEYAVSEGPGFGASFSLNGGLDQEAANPSYGLPGLRADSWRVAGRSNLAPLGLDGEIAGYFDRKKAGFSSPDHNIQHDQQAWGLSGAVTVSDRNEVNFGAETFRRDDGKRENKARIGISHQMDRHFTLEGEVSHSRRDQTGSPLDHGERTDTGMRLTWSRDDNLSTWVFGQATISRDTTRHRNDRLGIGAQIRMSERTDITAEVSDGSLGAAGRLELGHRPNENSVRTIGYRLDPMRRFDTTDFSGRDRGSLVFGASSQVNDRWTYTGESAYSAFGSRPSLTSGYGVSYTPDPRWHYDAMVQYGESTEADGSSLKRRGLSLGLRYNEADAISAGLRAEWRREDSDRPDHELDRKTWLVSGFYETRINPDWRFVSALDSVISQSDQSSFRNGRYIEARIGYAWRPVSNDRVNALLSYTYLHDLPGPDQVNIDGKTDGPRQKSHLLNAAINWQASPVWTVGAKYGYRMRKAAERSSHDFIQSEAHLAVLRADYHVVHNWDIMGELRILHTPGSSTTERAGLIGAYRLIGNNIRIGGGHLWGQVKDDLRSADAADRGLFLNVSTQF